MQKKCPETGLEKDCIENACGKWVEGALIRPFDKVKQGGVEITDYRFKRGAGCAIAILALKGER
jgi:hypothetical protein